MYIQLFVNLPRYAKKRKSGKYVRFRILEFQGSYGHSHFSHMILASLKKQYYREDNGTGGTKKRIYGLGEKHLGDRKTKENKTWSSVSNSSLSKTFALCQFRKIKLQQLCFLPPNIVLGLKKNESKNYFGSEKKFC